MIKNLQKSIFINILFSLVYVEFTLILLTPLLLIVCGVFLAFKIHLYSILPLTSYIIFPIYALPLGIACLIGAFFEIKNSETNGFVVSIPDKITNTWWYNILFWVGLIISASTTILCFSALLFFSLFVL